MSMDQSARAAFAARVTTLIGERLVRDDPYVHAAMTHATQHGLSVEETLAFALAAVAEAKNAAVANAMDLLERQPLVVVAPHDSRLADLIEDLKRITSQVTEALARLSAKAERIASHPAEHLNSSN